MFLFYCILIVYLFFFVESDSDSDEFSSKENSKSKQKNAKLNGQSKYSLSIAVNQGFLNIHTSVKVCHKYWLSIIFLNSII